MKDKNRAHPVAGKSAEAATVKLTSREIKKFLCSTPTAISKDLRCYANNCYLKTNSKIENGNFKKLFES